MIKGIGIDIVEIDRIKTAIKRNGKSFLDKVFTDSELRYCKKLKGYKYFCLAARFAAKEAYTKAIGTGMIGISWKQIEVSNDKLGKPHLLIKGKNKKNVHLSLSHSQNYAVASVVIE